MMLKIRIFYLFIQAFQGLLKAAAAASSQQSPKLSINKAAVINISTGMASITENGSGNMYSYRAAKVFNIFSPLIFHRSFA